MILQTSSIAKTKFSLSLSLSGTNSVVESLLKYIFLNSDVYLARSKDLLFPPAFFLLRTSYLYLLTDLCRMCSPITFFSSPWQIFFLLYASKISRMFRLLKLLACNGSSRVGLVILGMLRKTMLASLWFCCTSSILICFCKWWKSIGTLRVTEGRTSDGMDWVREIWDPGDIYLTYYVPRICFFKYSCLKKTHTAEIRLILFALYFS